MVMKSSRLSLGAGIMVNFKVPFEMHGLQLPLLQDSVLASFHTARAKPPPASLCAPRECHSVWEYAWVGIFAASTILANACDEVWG